MCLIACAGLSFSCADMSPAQPDFSDVKRCLEGAFLGPLQIFKGRDISCPKELTFDMEIRRESIFPELTA